MTPIETINDSYRSIIEKNADDIVDHYMRTEELYVILEGPRLSNRGHKNIEKGWRDFCKSPIRLAKIDWIEGPFVEEKKDMAWVAGVIELSVEVSEKSFSNTFRSTFVLTKNEEDHWRISHEHVSAAHQDPYGIGDWLVKEK